MHNVQYSIALPRFVGVLHLNVEYLAWGEGRDLHALIHTRNKPMDVVTSEHSPPHPTENQVSNLQPPQQLYKSKQARDRPRVGLDWG